LWTGTFIVMHAECRQADIEDLLFIHHGPGNLRRGGRIRIYAPNCSGRADRQREGQSGSS
jgi:hypothetical protein